MFVCKDINGKKICTLTDGMPGLEHQDFNFIV